MPPEAIQKAIETEILPQWQAAHPEMTAGRAGGLTGRALAEGAGNLVDLPGNLVMAAGKGGAAVGDFLRGLVGLRTGGGPPIVNPLPSAAGAISRGLDSVGMAKPATAGERVYSGAVGALPAAAATMDPAMLVPFMGGGAASQGAAEAGAGPVGQFAAGVAGGGATSLLQAPVRALADYAINQAAPAAGRAAQRALGTGGYTGAPSAGSGPGMVPDAVKKAILDAAVADRTPPSSIADQVAAATKAGQPFAPVDAAGANLAGLARSTVTGMGPGRQIASRALLDRSGEAAQSRMQGFTQELADGVTPQKVSAAYKSAVDENPAAVGTPEVEQLLTSVPAFRQAHEAFGPAIARAGEQPPSPLFSDVTDASGNVTGSQLARTPNVKDIDVIKRVIQEEGNPLRAGTASAADTEAMLALQGKLRQLLEHTDAQAPEYAEARRLGQLNIGRRDIEDTLAKTANTGQHPDFATRVVGAMPTSERALSLSENFPGRQAAVADYITKALRERKMQQTLSSQLGGSQTMNKGAEAGLLDVSPSDIVGMLHSPMTTGAKKLMDAITGGVQTRRNAGIAQQLFTPGGGNLDFWKELDAQYQRRMAAGGATANP
jgi:hypothetical protein